MNFLMAANIEINQIGYSPDLQQEYS